MKSPVRLFYTSIALFFLGAFIVAHGLQQGRSGIFIKPAHAWTHGVLSSAPAPAAAVGFNTRTFFDDFNSSSTIDLSLTGNPGFKWYLINAWPQATKGTAGWTGITTSTNTDPASISVSGGTMTKSTAIANVNQGIHTAIANGATYRGQVFKNGFYVQIRMAINPLSSGVDAAHSWPIYWFGPISFLAGNASLFTELDGYELFSGSNTLAVHDWNCGVNPCNQSSNGNLGWSTGPSDTGFHTYGTLWQTATQGGGTGSIKRYFDGVLQSANTVTWAPGGAFSALDADQHHLILDTGQNVNLIVDSVEVWQSSAADTVIQ